MKKAKFILASALITLLVLTFSISCLASNDQYISNVKEELPYEYSFSKEYVVAGKRVLDLTIHNKTDYDIKALEVEIRVKDAFKEVISDWSTFTNPELEIPAHSSSKTRLKLTKQNILGTTVENVLDEAKYIDLRYKRILFEGEVLLEKTNLYPELRGVHGNFKIDIDLFKRDDVQKDLYLINYNLGSNSNQIFEDSFGSGFGPFNMSNVAKTLLPKSIILQVTATNVSNQAVTKDWTKNTPSLIELTDSKKHQYSNYALLFGAQSLESAVVGDTSIKPGTVLPIIYVFDKINGYTPEKLTVYFEGHKYGKQIIYKE